MFPIILHHPAPEEQQKVGVDLFMDKLSLVPPETPLHYQQSRIPGSPQHCLMHIIIPDGHLASTVPPTSLSLSSVTCSPGSGQVPKLLPCFLFTFYLLVPLTDICTSFCRSFPNISASSQLLYFLYQCSALTEKQQGLSRVEISLFSKVTSDWTRGSVLRLCQERIKY